MSLKIGIVGLPNVGKSTLFNALIKKQAAEAQNFPFTTINPNIGVVSVPDKRLKKIAQLVKPIKTIATTVSFVDIAGLVKGAHQGEGLGNKFLAHIREVDAIALVVREFQDPNVTHVAGRIDPQADAEIILTELALADLAMLEARSKKQEARSKAGNKQAHIEKQLIDRLITQIGDQQQINHEHLNDIEHKILKKLQLFIAKPLMIILNLDENTLGQGRAEKLRQSHPLFTHFPIIEVSAKLESELAGLTDNEQVEYLNSLGVNESGLNQVINQAYRLLGLITFFTAGPKEVRAWTIQSGAKAPEAAGCIHTDFERGFIRAEVISYDDFVRFGGEHGAKAAGRLRSEGRDYIVQDADIIHFRFNV